jgi:hypothetical protein
MRSCCRPASRRDASSGGPGGSARPPLASRFHRVSDPLPIESARDLVEVTDRRPPSPPPVANRDDREVSPQALMSDDLIFSHDVEGCMEGCMRDCTIRDFPPWLSGGGATRRHQGQGALAGRPRSARGKYLITWSLIQLAIQPSA